MKMDVYQAIKKRRSIRRFKQDNIPLEILERLVDCARLAPSASNLQPLEFIIVKEPEVVELVFPTLGWAGYLGEKGPPPPGQRPSAYIVVLVNRNIRDNAAHDSGAAIENILLAATSEGIGSCWIGSIEREKLAEILSLPENYEIDSVVALGYPDEASVVEEFSGSTKYWKDEDGVMHVPKRNFGDMVHYDKFGNKKHSV